MVQGAVSNGSPSRAECQAATIKEIATAITILGCLINNLNGNNKKKTRQKYFVIITFSVNEE